VVKTDDHTQQRLVTASPSPETQSDPAGMGELLSLLHRHKPLVCDSRLLCRGSYLALADEEAWPPSSEEDTACTLAESSPSHAQGLAGRQRRTVSSLHAAGGTLSQRMDAHSCLHLCSRRAGCITKDASPVRSAGIRIRRCQHRTALMLDPTARCGRVRAGDPRVERGRCLYAGVSGVGSGYEFCQSESDARVGGDHGGAGLTRFHPLRQRTRVHQPAFSGVGHRAEDRGRAYSTGEADTECSRGELSRAAARRVSERELVSESVRCQAQDRSVEDGIQRRTSVQQFGVSDTERVCGAGNNELWKRRLPKNGMLGKR
jgi:hypothetical protein